MGVKINGALFAKEHHVPHNHISRWIKVKEIFTNWILKTKQIFEIIVKKYSFYYLFTKGAIFSKCLHSKTIFINEKICTYFIDQNKYLRIYEDNFGAKILTDDCALRAIYKPCGSFFGLQYHNAILPYLPYCENAPVLLMIISMKWGLSASFKSWFSA